ncbi:MAG TPA: hypothetical protein VF432_10895 [Thermoanaerobaculia bacterium]
MRAAWIIAAREVREKSRLFLLCAALAVVPFAATLLPGTSGQAADTIAVVGRILSATLGLGIAVTLGTSIARDLAERRMSFYFSKPVSASAIWIGKAAAAVFIMVACFAVIGVPAMLASGRAWALTNPQWMGAAALAMVTLYLLTHTLSTVFRSRSPLIAADFVFLVVAVAVTWLIVRPLFFGIAWGTPPILYALGAAVVAVLAIAPVWQLANGRSDIRRSHAALMRFVWPAIGVVLLIAGGFVAWLTHVPAEELAIAYIDQPQRGSQVMVSGAAPGRFDYETSFLLDRATGRVTRLGTPLWWGAQFSDDGRVAAWLQPVGLFTVRGLELHTAAGPTGITMPLAARFGLSGDGSRVAISNGSLVSVHEVATGRLLASAAGFDGRSRHLMFFVTPDLLRVIEHEPRLGAATALRIFDFDVRARKTRKTGERLLNSQRDAVSVSGDGSRMFLPTLNAIADGRTGETLAQLAVANVTDSEVLHDGRVVLITREPGAYHLRTFERDGTPRHDVPLRQAPIWIAAETETGKLILAEHGKTMVVVDLARGAIERTLPGIRGPIPRWSRDPRLPRYAADQQFAAIDAKGKLTFWRP